MKKFSFFIIFFLVSQVFTPCLNAQKRGNNIPEYTNKVFNEKIKTVQLHRDDWNLSYPIIKLKSNEKLVLNFDLLADQPENYYYSFIHCDKDWNRSDIFVNEYLDGYEENPIEDYRASFNTTVDYYHYKLIFPNERVSFNVSGNYVLLVYPAGKVEKPEIILKFIVAEESARIDASAHRPQMTKENESYQQIDFNVNLAGLNINDPYRNIYAFILQNGRWDSSKKNLKPDFYGNNELRYNSLSDRNIFPGGNEYRYFDIKSIRYQSEFVRQVEFRAPYYNVYLQPSEDREFKPYFYWKDFNGKYVIAFQEGQDPDIDADYVFVYFTLPAFQPAEGGNLYISGALSNWSFGENNMMIYNPERKQYEGVMLLKQGWYNYEYVLHNDNEADVSSTIFEGSHYETENDYLILIYYRNPRERYDRIIGTAVTNTLNKMTR